MEDEFVLGIMEKSYLVDKCGYTEAEIEDIWNIPPVGPEIGPLVKYDFYHQHDIHCGENGQYFKYFVPDDEMNRSWTRPEESYKGHNSEIRDKYIYQRVYQGYKLNLYTEYEHNLQTNDNNYSASSGANVVFLSKDIIKTIMLWNHDHKEALNDTIHMHDILYFAACYYSHRIGRSAPYNDEFPKDRYAMILQLFREDGAIAAAADEDGCFYRGALLEALKRIYIYTSYKKAPFDHQTILLAMRIVQKVPLSITPKFTPGRPTCTYDIDFDEFMYFDVRYPNPDGSLCNIYSKRSLESRENDINKWIGRPYKPLITSNTTKDEIYDLVNNGVDLLGATYTIRDTKIWIENKPIKSLFSKETKYKHIEHRLEGMRKDVCVGITYFDHDGNECDWFAMYGTGEKINKGYRWG